MRSTFVGHGRGLTGLLMSAIDRRAKHIVGIKNQIHDMAARSVLIQTRRTEMAASAMFGYKDM